MHQQTKPVPDIDAGRRDHREKSPCAATLEGSGVAQDWALPVPSVEDAQANSNHKFLKQSYAQQLGCSTAKERRAFKARKHRYSSSRKDLTAHVRMPLVRTSAWQGSPGSPRKRAKRCS
ncbi:UNVERIFIED_CONTAM: hypothetical protein HHA_452790 [Hammondia hammondi]|eukprot:XP_008886007.1 hypothetical protein HHA_452790 [Hammondia hammondi]